MVTQSPMSSQSPTEQEIEAVVQLMGQIRLCNYATVSMVTFMLYDIMINLEREVPLVWYQHAQNHPSNPHDHLRKVKRVFVHTLFIFARYYGLVYLTIMLFVNNSTGFSIAVYVLVSFIERFEQSPQILLSCKAYLYFVNLAGTVVYGVVVNVILAMRISALNRGNRHCRAALTCLVVGEFLVDYLMSVVMAVRTADEVASPPPWSLQPPGCTVASCATPALVLACWITVLSVCTIFCAITLKCIVWGGCNERLSLEKMLRLPPRTRVFLLDAVTVYFLTFAIVLISTVVLTVVKNELSTLVVPPLVATYSFCASRLVLNIRAVDDKHCLADAPEDPDSLPPLVFLEEQPVASSSACA